MENKYYLNDILASEKNMVVNMATSLNEASCEKIYKAYYKMFEEASKAAQELFVIGFNKGYFTLENEDYTKISKEYDTLNDEINNCI